MSLPTERSIYLLKSWSSRQATADEVRELADWVQEQKDASSIEAYLTGVEKEIRQSNVQELIPAIDWEKLFNRILAEREIGGLPVSMQEMPNVDYVGGNRSIKKLQYFRRSFFKYAAAILVFLVVGAYFWINRDNKKHPLEEAVIVPGGERAMLTLGDGSTIILDKAANGLIAQQENSRIVKRANGEIAYEPDGKSNAPAVLNTLATPKGGQYQLTLPDGTKVWLNAASSITYPTAFTGPHRNVKVEGEVYFEVTKNKQRPFMVNVSGKTTIEVLGTHFNVNSYADESMMATTLLEGRIKISLQDPGHQNNGMFLSPGEQALIHYHKTDIQTSDRAIIVNRTVDPSQAMAWKNGVFNFHDMDLPAVLRQLARWYDLEIRYEGKPSSEKFRGEMSRQLPLSEVLELLSGLNIEFQISGRTLIVKTAR